jgi:hypothetical protein
MALKGGFEDKKKVAIAATLGVILLGMIVYTIMDNFGGSSAPAVQTAAPAPVAAPAVNTASGNATRRSVSASRAHDAAKVGSAAAMNHLDPTLHPELMAAAESLEYTGKGRNIFSMSAALPVIPAVIGPVRPGPQGPPVAAGPPPPPPIDLKFFGFSAVKSGARKAFLLHGEDVFIASEGDVVDHRYKVVKISPLSLQVEDIPYHNTQTLQLVQN